MVETEVEAVRSRKDSGIAVKRGIGCDCSVGSSCDASPLFDASLARLETTGTSDSSSLSSDEGIIASSTRDFFSEGRERCRLVFESSCLRRFPVAGLGPELFFFAFCDCNALREPDDIRVESSVEACVDLVDWFDGLYEEPLPEATLFCFALGFAFCLLCLSASAEYRAVQTSAASSTGETYSSSLGVSVLFLLMSKS